MSRINFVDIPFALFHGLIFCFGFRGTDCGARSGCIRVGFCCGVATSWSDGAVVVVRDLGLRHGLYGFQSFRQVALIARVDFVEAIRTVAALAHRVVIRARILPVLIPLVLVSPRYYVLHAHRFCQ